MNKLVYLLLFGIQFSVFSQESYEDSLRSERVKHFSELTDSSKHILNKEEIANLFALDYFQIDKKNVVTAFFTVDKGKKFKMKTSTARTPIYRRYGYLDFEINGKKVRLTAFQNMELKRKKEYKKHLFVPFSDLTSGEITYGGGRYIDLKIPQGTTIKIDFNTAYNPYCVYSHRYSCPIPPIENKLDVKIEAGEKTPKMNHEY
ncbi:MAG: DUF1684 domain-containing protein [Bacteroidota bacterium]